MLYRDRVTFNSKIINKRRKTAIEKLVPGYYLQYGTVTENNITAYELIYNVLYLPLITSENKS